MKRFLLLSVVLFAASVFAPAAHAITVHLLTQDNRLVTFDSASPGTAPASVAITGLGAFNLVGMDVRTTVQTLSPKNPGAGTLWALGIDGSYSRLFVINPATAVATPVGPVLTGIDNSGGDNAWFFGHNPGTDRFRLINFKNNYELNPNSMTFVKQTDMDGFPNPNGSAFETASYGQNPKLYLIEQAPNDSLHVSTDIASGTYTPVGDTGLSFSIGSGLDIHSGTTLFAATVGVANLYSINRSTGTATMIGAISGNPMVRAIAIMPSLAELPKALPASLKVKGKKRIETSAASVKIRGTAKSQVGIKRVDYRVGKAKAKKAKGKTKWSAKVRVKPGLNVITFRAVGMNDVLSKPAKVRVRRS